MKRDSIGPSSPPLASAGFLSTPQGGPSLTNSDLLARMASLPSLLGRFQGFVRHALVERKIRIVLAELA